MGYRWVCYRLSYVDLVRLSLGLVRRIAYISQIFHYKNCCKNIYVRNRVRMRFLGVAQGCQQIKKTHISRRLFTCPFFCLCSTSVQAQSRAREHTDSNSLLLFTFVGMLKIYLKLTVGNVVYLERLILLLPKKL